MGVTLSDLIYANLMDVKWYLIVIIIIIYPFLITSEVERASQVAQW